MHQDGGVFDGRRSHLPTDCIVRKVVFFLFVFVFHFLLSLEQDHHAFNIEVQELLNEVIELVGLVFEDIREFEGVGLEKESETDESMLKNFGT